MYSKINFVVTDNTANILVATKIAGGELSLEIVPSSLMCNAYPLLMVQTKIKEMCSWE